MRIGPGSGLRRAAPVFGALVLTVGLAACSVTGTGFNSAGLNQIVEGRTTQAEAVRSLGAPPVDTWARGDGSVLARWAWKGTMATDALYVRQEVWLLFGPDGTFQRTEKTINIPITNHTRTAGEAERDAPGHAAGQAAVELPAYSAAEPAAVMPSAPVQPVIAPTVQAQPAAAADAPVPVAGGPLLPPGTTYVPGVSYPIHHSH